MIIVVDCDHEVILDNNQKTNLRISPIHNHNIQGFQFDKLSEFIDEEKPEGLLNYDNIFCRTETNLNLAQSQTIQNFRKEPEEENKEESFVVNSESRSAARDEEENITINEIKEFSAKSSRIFAESELSRLDESMTSQNDIKPLSSTNSSIISNYLFKQYPGQQPVTASIPMLASTGSKATTAVTIKTSSHRYAEENQRKMTISQKIDQYDCQALYNTVR